MTHQSSPTRRIVIVTGLSGAGKSQALKVLEDAHFFCVDNLPLPMLGSFLEFWEKSGETLSQVALGMDIRGRIDPADTTRSLQALKQAGHPLEILFLEADEKTLFSRFRGSRRPHPLSDGSSILELIRLEGRSLEPLRRAADWVVDTSPLSIHQLRRVLLQHFAPETANAPVRVTLQSFGYRQGLPFDADLVFDVRFLPNPFFVPELREQNGRDAPVSDYVFKHELSRDFLDRLTVFLEFLLPQYQREGKTYLTIGIGCTGGQHRSVAMVEALGARLTAKGVPLEIRHRDLPAEPGATKDG